MRIETERLLLRGFEPKDRDDLGEYMLQRVDQEFEGYPDFTPDKLDGEIAYRCQSEEFFAIELKAERKVIGNIYLGKREFGAKELGFVLNSRYQARGYGSEAARAALLWAFSQGVRRVYAECAPENAPSWKTLERIGLRREGRLRQNVSFHNGPDGKPIYWDTFLYAALAEDCLSQTN